MCGLAWQVFSVEKSCGVSVGSGFRPLDPCRQKANPRRPPGAFFPPTLFALCVKEVAQKIYNNYILEEKVRLY